MHSIQAQCDSVPIVFNFVAQLYTLPEAYAKEVLDISAKFMLGPGQWFKGRHNPVPHPYFRARVDIGMKAVPRCIVSQVQTINYMSARQCLLSAGSKVAILEGGIGEHLSLTAVQHSISAISHSPFGHASRTQVLIQNIVDVRSLPPERHEIKEIVYGAVFDHAHPRVTLLHRFDSAYRTRWIKLGCLNDRRRGRYPGSPGYPHMSPPEYMWQMLGCISMPGTQSADINKHI